MKHDGKDASSVAASGCTPPNSFRPDVDRRNMALTVLGALGATAMVKGLAPRALDDIVPEPNEAKMGGPPNATTGTAIAWVDTVFGSGGPNNRNLGDLNKFPQQMQDICPVIAIAKGAVTPGDGGGGVFFWSEETDPTDDGGTIIVPKAGNEPPVLPEGCWKRIYDGPLNAKWFGTGPYSRIGIQAAIDAAAEAGGGSVYIPPGEYSIDKAISVKTNVELCGAGPSTILKLADTLDPSVVPQDFDTVVIRVVGQRNVRIADLQVDGNKQRHPPNCEWNTQNGIVVMAVRPWHVPIAGQEPVRAEDILIENCISRNCVGHGICAISSRRVIIRNCTVRDNGRDDAQPNGIDITSGDANGLWAGGSEDCVVEGCTAFDNVHGGIESWGRNTLRTRILKCRTDSILVNLGMHPGNCTATPDLAYARVDVTIMDCYIDHSKRTINDPAIQLNFASGVTIANCHIICNQDGITGGTRPCAPCTPEPDLSIVPRGNVIIGNTFVYVGPCNPSPITPDEACPSGQWQYFPGPCTDNGPCSDDKPGNCIRLRMPGGPASAISLGTQRDLVIANNTITGFYTSIQLMSCSKTTIAKNTISSVDRGVNPRVNSSGIQLTYKCTDITITKNSIRSVWWGIKEVEQSNHIVILYNILLNCGDLMTTDGGNYNGAEVINTHGQPCDPSNTGAGSNSLYPPNLNLPTLPNVP